MTKEKNKTQHLEEYNCTNTFFAGRVAIHLKNVWLFPFVQGFPRPMLKPNQRQYWCKTKLIVYVSEHRCAGCKDKDPRCYAECYGDHPESISPYQVTYSGVDGKKPSVGGSSSTPAVNPQHQWLPGRLFAVWLGALIKPQPMMAMLFVEASPATDIASATNGRIKASCSLERIKFVGGG